MGSVTFRRFEDIDAWRTARKLNAETSRITKQGSLERDYGLKDQLQRAAASVMANIAEGFCHKSDKEFARYLLTAKASALEFQSHLYVAIDRESLSPEQFKILYGQAQTCTRQLSRLISYLLKRK